MMTNLIVSDSAKDYIAKMISQDNGIAFRLSVKKTGCSGYAYAPAIIKEAKAHDEVLSVNGINIYLDTAWLDLFDGLEIDYIEENKAGLKQRRLVFNNKKESGRCGCGESFHLENKDV